MSLQIMTNINVDFYDKKYILINAKQYDSNSRWISVTCYNQGTLYNLSSSKHTAYIRYRKADEKEVLNSCRIDYRGNVLVELTEQMLAADGICYVDLIIVDKGNAIVNVDTGEIITIDGSAIISTMAFCVNVYEAAFDSSITESSYEFGALNDALQMANAEYKEVIQLARSYAIGDANNIRENENFDNSKYYSRLSRSYAIGDANGIRTNENIDNAKYYSEQSKASADNADESEAKALASENAAKDSASQSANSANESATSAKASANSANESKNSMNSASTSASAASESATSALNSATSASESATSALNSATSASESATNAAKSAENALNSENIIKEYISSIDKATVDEVKSYLGI